MLFYPNYVDEFHWTLTPTVSIPFAHDLNFGLEYSTQTYRGAYGTTFSQNISQRKDDFIATLTYNIPKIPGSIGVAFGNQKYTDNVLSTYNFNQRREAIDFTTRF